MILLRQMSHLREFLRGDITACEDHDYPLFVSPHYFVADESSQGRRS